MRSIFPFSFLKLARVERFELPSTVLETAILPLNYTRIGSSTHIPNDWAAKIRIYYKKQVHFLSKCTCFIDLIRKLI